MKTKSVLVLAVVAAASLVAWAAVAARQPTTRARLSPSQARELDVHLQPAPDGGRDALRARDQQLRQRHPRPRRRRHPAGRGSEPEAVRLLRSQRCPLHQLMADGVSQRFFCSALTANSGGTLDPQMDARLRVAAGERVRSRSGVGLGPWDGPPGRRSAGRAERRSSCGGQRRASHERATRSLASSRSAAANASAAAAGRPQTSGSTPH